MNLSKQLNYYSLGDKEEISLILKYGTKKFTQFGPVFFYHKSCADKKIKIAFLVKKSIGKAHYRNYVKRILRYYVRINFTLLKKYNRVIFLYRFPEKIKFSALKDEYNKKLIFN